MTDPSDLPFKYIGGNPALDLVNTTDWTRRGPENERLTDFSQLTGWAEGAGILSSRGAAALRSRARVKPREAEAAYRAALKTRHVLHALFTEVAIGRRSGDELGEFNQLLGRSLEHMRIVPGKGQHAFRLSWEEPETRLDAIPWPVVWSAATLLASDEWSQIRICGGEDCGWMYVDRSRNGLRRWCQMETCGTREKSRRRYRGQAVRRSVGPRAET
jgi:predicted RNA-binding Zn ribbon-like protein